MSKRNSKNNHMNASKSQRQTSWANRDHKTTTAKNNRQPVSNVPVKRDKGQAVVRSYLESMVDEIAQAVDGIKAQLATGQKINVAKVVRNFETVLKGAFEALETFDQPVEIPEETTKGAQDYYFAQSDVIDNLRVFVRDDVNIRNVVFRQRQYKQQIGRDVGTVEIWNAERGIKQALSTALKYFPIVKPYATQDVDFLESVKKACRRAA